MPGMKFYGITSINGNIVNHDTVGQSDRLLKNNGDGTFTEQTKEGNLVGKEIQAFGGIRTLMDVQICSLPMISETLISISKINKVVISKTSLKRQSHQPGSQWEPIRMTLMEMADLT